MTTKTILFLDHTARMGGGEIALLRLVTALDRRRFTPVVALGADGPLRTSLAQAGIETHILALGAEVRETRKATVGVRSLLRPGPLLSTLSYLWRLARFLKTRRIDVLHTNSLKADILGGIAARCTGVPLVWHVRDRIAPDYLPARAVQGFRILGRTLPRRIIANSAATADTLGAAAQSRSRVIHDGIPSTCKPLPPPQPPEPIAGLLGRITPWKGQHIFIRAAHLLHRRFPEARFRIIGCALFGEEAYERELRKLVRLLRLQDVLTFTGFQEDIPAALAPLACAVHASTLAEPFGQIVAEAMACGKPVVATNGGGVPEIVVHGRTGLLVPMGDAEALAAAMETLLRNPQLARRMGRAGQARIARHFTIEQTARKVEAVYAELGNDTDAAD
ncbi:MAG: glycosyltransferase family 4 protein [Chthoniobacteraceae bacterium]|nr:glycosyltransferase family 4 protein [Chthoniobacteraceae bacterium]